MPSVAELTAGYERFMLSPRLGADVCEACFNFTSGYARCYACDHVPRWLDAMAPISYSIGGEPLHQALAGYKRLQGDTARRLTSELAAVLWRHLAAHERCLASATGVAAFELVTSVPSGDRDRDERHPLRRIVGELAGPTRDRHRRLLRRSASAIPPRCFHDRKYEPLQRLEGQSVLLIDDTWTTGANAQSAAHALKSAGAGAVAAVVIGRHLNREWHENDRRLHAMGRPFDWTRCAHCGIDRGEARGITTTDRARGASCTGR